MRLSVVIVAWNEAEVLQKCLPALTRELGPGDEIIVSDNASEDGTPDVVRSLAPEARIVQNGGNVGFPAACNSGAAAATGDVIVLLNPDTVVAPGWADGIRRPLREGRGWSLWQGLVTMDDGTRINTDGGVVHFSGVSWAGHMGEGIDGAASQPQEIGFASGACMALERSTWERLGGMPEHFFLYFDDVEISLRLRLTGELVGIEPSARVDHLYEFDRRSVKWRMLEKNRWATVLRTYPGPVLAVSLPALILCELGILAAATAGGWGGQKLRAIGDVLRSLPRFMRERREVQRGRTISSREFASYLVADLDSPYLGPVARIAPLRWGLRLYWAIARAILRVFP